ETDAKRLADYFKLNYATEKVNRLANISSELNLSEWKIIKLSKTLFNRSPHQYVMYLRMDTAQKLIRQTTMSIKDIALTIGFDNKAYFSNAFHKYYGMSPAEFRKKV
ncbi:AraC family transcriptional regulator, partial [Mucilaginibacter pineti]